MRPGLAAVAIALSACACVGSASLQAGGIYRWKDRSGVVNYGDHQPDAPNGRVERIPVQAEAEAMVRLRIEEGDGVYRAWADNSLAGPIEVM